MKQTRKLKKGGEADVKQGQTFGQMIGVKEWRDPDAIKKANALMSNPLFSGNKGQAPPVNKEKLKGFAQSFLGSLFTTGSNGKPKLTLPNQNKMKRNTAAFSTAMGFAPQAAPPPVKNLFGNPVVGNNVFGPNPGENPWQIKTGTSGWHFGLTRGGKRKTKSKKRI